MQQMEYQSMLCLTPTRPSQLHIYMARKAGFVLVWKESVDSSSISVAKVHEMGQYRAVLVNNPAAVIKLRKSFKVAMFEHGYENNKLVPTKLHIIK